ncbi:hypothetical protein QZM97_08595 [Burkholderia orbicola]|uniref:hypothetical protein n=1 Tax=Burkholderia cepacia complex TaxID=87882 RepID=UPI0012BA6B83|nr:MULTISPECIES: hypothetical protein [Burkholderia cepacia complex]MDN7779605.1 hypothetical protein [Burkholderia orbicola]MDN7990145.1 hypothetical protein [Burkholderia orbicola]
MEIFLILWMDERRLGHTYNGFKEPDIIQTVVTLALGSRLLRGLTAHFIDHDLQP